ncbi:MAG TPA: ATP-binding protein, partial [Syntrophales bacterium]|nr:ATP-binding protein [Syntrophales bacterium]
TDQTRPCRCTAQQIRQYQARISGPLLDRIDIHIEVPSVKYKDLAGRLAGESSAAIKGRIEKARVVQRERFPAREIQFNARMSDKDVKLFCKVDEDSQKLIEMAIEKLGLSVRAYTKVLKIGRTIADLEEDENIQPRHVAEAIQHRSLDRKMI